MPTRKKSRRKKPAKHARTSVNKQIAKAIRQIRLKHTPIDNDFPSPEKFLKALRKVSGIEKGRRIADLANVIRAKYDVAQTTPENRRHWALADTLDAVESNSPSVRTYIRTRARYEFDNNPYLFGQITTFANDVIGTGPRTEFATGDMDMDRQIGEKLTLYFEGINVGQFGRLSIINDNVDGEAFLRLFTPKNSIYGVELDIEPIDAGLVENPYDDNSSFTNGIKFDTDKKPVSYSIKKSSKLGTEYEEVDAKYIIHWFDKRRSGQIRGIPRIVSSLPLGAKLRRYTSAVVAAAETAAELAMFLKTDLCPDDQAAQLSTEDFSELEIDRNVMTTLPEGWEPAQVTPQQPATTYQMFKHEMIGEQARPLSMPFNIAACNSSSYNYASGRLDHQTYYKFIDIIRSDFELVVLDRIVTAWLEEAIKVYGWKVEIDKINWQYLWTGREHVDPNKEATAQDTNLKNKTKTYKEAYAARGLDWRAEFKQISDEQKLMNELGITPEKALPAPANNNPDPDNRDGEPNVDDQN